MNMACAEVVLFVVVMLLQTLLSELQLPSVVDDNFLCIIMSCCHILVTSSTFGLSLTTKFDHMVGSSAGLCHVIMPLSATSFHLIFVTSRIVGVTW